MRIDDRFTGDTNPLVMWLYDVDENGKETPVKLIDISATVEFKYKKGTATTTTITGVNMTNEGYVEFPFLTNSVVEGDYVCTIRVVNGATSESMVYDKGAMIIRGDI